MRNLFIALSCILVLSACTNSEFENLSKENGEELIGSLINVSFDFTGDYVDITETPLTSRAFAENAKTFYAIQIDEITYVKVMKGEEKVVKHYAYGIFSDIKNARVSLPEGEYIFSALIIEEREDTIFSRDGHYTRPFCMGGLFDSDYLEKPIVSEEFIKTDEFGLDLIDSDFTQETINSGIKMARLDRYYGTTEVELDDEEQISIDMDRYAFAITYNVAPPIDGTIKIKAPDFGRTFYEVEKDDNQVSQQYIYNAPLKEKDETYDLNIVILWERGSDELEEYKVEKTIKIERNKNYIFNIDMNSRDSEQTFDLNVNATLTDESITID